MNPLIGIAVVVLLVGVFFGWRSTHEKVQTVTLPVPAAPTGSESFALTVIVKGKGEFMVDGVGMDFERVKKAIAGKKWGEHAALKVVYESKTAFGEAASVLDFARQCGATHVTVSMQ